MNEAIRCPECGASWSGGEACEEHFHQMLFWENEQPALGEVHHLMVLCYHLQHPSLYSPDGLVYAMDLLRKFVAEGITPQEVRSRERARVDSGKRSWKIKGSAGSTGAYDHPVPWKMTAKDVVDGGPEQYIGLVHRWSQVILAQLRESGNLSA